MDNDPSGEPAHPPAEHLDSWKEIAAYLQRGVRTVKRWEQREGLPVHRHRHTKRASVYAIRSELDAWWKHRPAGGEFQSRSTPTRHLLLLGLAGGTVVTVAVVVALSTASRPASVPPLEFTERDWVLVTDFENRTGEAVLEGTLKGALTRELSNSQFVNVVPPERVGDVLRLMRQPVDAPLDRERGLEVALRDGGIRAVLAGRVEKLDSTYLLSAFIVNPTTGVTMASVSREAEGERALVAEIRQLSNGVREMLGEALPDIAETDQQLAQVTTPSLRALQLYSQADAVIAGRGGPNGEVIAEELLKRAVTEDPDFASAYIHLAHAVRNQRRPPEEYRPFAERAFALAETTSDRERYFILGSYHSMFDRVEESIAAYETLVLLHPDHYWGTNNLAISYQRAGRDEEAGTFMFRRADLRPQNLRVNASSALIAIQRGVDIGVAMPYVQRVRTLAGAETPPGRLPPPTAVWLRFFPAYEHLLAGKAERALAVVGRLADDSSAQPEAMREWSVTRAVMAYVALGTLDAAEAMARHMSNEALRQDQLSDIAWARGDRQAAKTHGQHGTPMRRVVTLPLVGELRWARAFLADPSSVRMPPQLYERVTPIVRGQVALAERDTAAAIELLQDGLGPLRGNPSLYLVGSESLADAWEKRGDMEQAVRVLAAASHMRDRVYFGGINAMTAWQRIEAERARLLRKLDRDDEAAPIEAKLLKLLAVADENHQILRDLKAAQAARQSVANLATPSGN